MDTLMRRGARMCFEQRGTGEPPLLLLHGLGNHQHFARQIEHFSTRHRVVAPDLPGFGASDAPTRRSYAIPDLVDDVAWLCEQCELRDAVVVGHSMGCVIGLELAAARPDLVSAIVLLDPTPIASVPAFRQNLGPLVEALHTPGFRDAIRGFADARMFRPSDERALRARIVENMCAVPQHVIESAFDSLLAWDGEQVAPRVSAPALLISAGDGMPADIARTRELVPTLEFGRTVGAGHFAHALVPEQVNAMIESFLALSRAEPALA